MTLRQNFWLVVLLYAIAGLTVVAIPVVVMTGELMDDARCAGSAPDSPDPLQQIGSPEPGASTISPEPGTRSLSGRDTSEDALDRVIQLLHAMQQVESGGDRFAVGDYGRSKGPLQIGRAYWSDSWRDVPDAPVYDEEVWSVEQSERTVVRYWNRYEPDALRRADVEVLNRLHNGGPAWRYKNTDAYWTKVQAAMKEMP